MKCAWAADQVVASVPVQVWLGLARMTVGNKRNEVRGTDGVSVRMMDLRGDRSAGVGHSDERVTEEREESLAVPGRSAQGKGAAIR